MNEPGVKKPTFDRAVAWRVAGWVLLVLSLIIFWVLPAQMGDRPLNIEFTN